MNNIRRCELARDRLADVYYKEAKDEIYDNSNLTTLNNAILAVEQVIKHLQDRKEE